MSDVIRSNVAQASYGGQSEGGIFAPRLNKRAELVFADLYMQLVQDGRVFCISNPTIETAVAMGGTSFADTTPAILIDIPSGTTMIPLEVRMDQGGTVAGGDITVHITVDDIARYSTGGTALTPVNMRTDSDAPTSVATPYYGATAAANSDAHTLFARLIAEDVTPTAEVQPTSCVLWQPRMPPFLVGPSSLLIHSWAATTQPSWFFDVLWAEIPTANVV